MGILRPDDQDARQKRGRPPFVEKFYDPIADAKKALDLYRKQEKQEFKWAKGLGKTKMSPSEKAKYQGYVGGQRAGKTMANRTMLEQHAEFLKLGRHEFNEYREFDKKKFMQENDKKLQQIFDEMLGDLEQMSKFKKIQKDKEFRKKKIEAKRKKEPDMSQKIDYYTGIGSRETPDYILDLMEDIAMKFREQGFRLRSGHAEGADQAFGRGAGPDADIYLPWPTFNQEYDFAGEYDEDKQIIVKPSVIVAPSPEAINIAAAYHPNWAACNETVRKLHGRNVHQVLGSLPAGRPVKSACVICWTPDGQASGGTGQAIRIAEKAEIPVWNLWDEDTYDIAFEWIYADGDLTAM